MITLEDKFHGHLILYCKGAYKVKTEDFFEGLKKIWAIRCGYDYNQTNRDVLRYIANDMYEIISICAPKKLPHIIGILHQELSPTASSFGKPENMLPIEAIIWEYRGALNNLKVREHNEKGKIYWIIKLPKPQRQLFNRILRGKGRYEDYKLVKG